MSNNDIEQWIEDLLQEDHDTRLQAFYNLEAHGDARMVEPLTRIVQDESLDPKIRYLAIEVLVAFGDPMVFDALLIALQDPMTEMRTSAIWGLRDLGDPRGVKPLERVLHEDDSPSVRGVTAITLGRLGGKQAVRALSSALVNDQSGFVRACAAESLRVIGDLDAIDALIAALKDDDEGVRQESVNALGDLGDERAVKPLIAALNDRQPDIQESAARSLEKIGTQEALAALEEWNEQR